MKVDEKHQKTAVAVDADAWKLGEQDSPAVVE